MVAKREYKLTVMLSDEEEGMLAAVADRRGLTASDWVRQAIRLAHEGEPVPSNLQRLKTITEKKLTKRQGAR